MIGRLQRLPLRTVWPHEAHDFTVWMEDNIDALDDELGLGIAAVQREQSSGVFSVDLLCETEGGGRVVVENQLEPSDHRHLGQIVTYLAAFDAEAAVWVVANARPEHVQAVAWLNESTAASFYLVKVEAVRIGDSAPAPVFTLVVGPSEGARQIGERKQELDERQRMFKRFWAGVIERDPEAPAGAPHFYWMRTGPHHVPGAVFTHVVLKAASRAELYLNATPEANAELYHRLHSQSAAIEAAFGEPLDWDFDESRRAQRVASHLPIGWGDEERWPELQERLVALMARFRGALLPFLS
ncbi:MAG TPA: DUF4268 domain-containing protein [Bacteroidetes bacterium]|nr:DUF4268 domain-containing protein [Bacteroidota bacterium]HIL58278.1 DUF4268 domain-containing protein [Rhodothermales bacterium]